MNDRRYIRGFCELGVAAADLVGESIDSLSVNPSSLTAALKVATDAERRYGAAGQ